LDKLRKAWTKYLVIAYTKFDDIGQSVEYFGQSLTPLQYFAQSFLLVSVDYLRYLHAGDVANYHYMYGETIKAFGVLETWANAAHTSMFSRMSNSMNARPCRNGAQMDSQMAEWSGVFKSTYVSPIAAYIDKLEELNRVLVSKGGWFMGEKGATCDKTCQSKGMLCDADKQSTITTQSAVKNAFSDAGYECKSFHDSRDYAGAPFRTGKDNDDCAPLIAGSKSVCNGNLHNQYPLCYCK